MRLIETYKWVDGKPLNERKHWLGDDYVKFIRFAQEKMASTPQGVVAIITNHAFLENPTFRGMRQSLHSSFDRIYTFNLHGNSRRRERSPDGTADENVFDIEQGVAITLLLKGVERSEQIFYRDMWGKRLPKYRGLSESNLAEPWVQVRPSSPMHFFSPHVPHDFEKWFEIWSLDDIFLFSSVGVLTARDHLTVGFSASETSKKAADFVSRSEDDARKRFFLGEDSRDWTVAGAQADLRGQDLNTIISPLAYRVFDTRYMPCTWRSRGYIGQPARPLSRSRSEANVFLSTTKRVEIGEFRHALVSAEVPDGHFVAAKETNHCYPLYLPEGDSNLTGKFQSWIAERYDSAEAPETILGYIYALLYSTDYRALYSDFLLVDAPRIPFPEARAPFEALAALGWELVQAHLLKETPNPDRLADFPDKGTREVEAVRYSPQEEAIWINKTQRFAPVPGEVWNFHIGGYQVLDKYLKSRKGRTLSLDEINHVADVAGVLQFTIAQMARIDAAYRAAFPAGDKPEAPLASGT